VDEWRKSGALCAFYKDPKGFAYSFQSYTLATRIKSIRNALAAQPDADVVIIERSPVSDNMFWKIQDSTECEKEMYNSWYEVWQCMLPFNIQDARIIYLRTSLDQCMKRMISRNRSEETSGGGVSREYQQKLIEAHDDALIHGNCAYNPKNVIKIDGEYADKDYRGADREYVINAIFDKIEQSY
jgi:deoxyadenosine/deoxycytidine kinase